MTRRTACLTALALAGTAAPAAARSTATDPAGWDRAEQRAVARTGLLPVLADRAFHAERDVTGTQARDALAVLAARLGTEPAPGVPAGRLSIRSFDRDVVAQLGLGDVAVAVQAEARRAGLRPPPSFGDEVVARLLRLRPDHPYGADQLERYPWQAITRGEAAWTLAAAQALAADPAAVEDVREQLARFTLPRYTARQLRLAVAKIGMPYVWGGETDTASGGQVHGGYDCSGFAWRVFKLSGAPQGPQLRGRTAAQQAGEIPRGERIRLADVEPADLLFFGAGRFWQAATERRITHMGIALSADWMVQASGSTGGVSVAPLFTPRRARSFSWARRLR